MLLLIINLSEFQQFLQITLWIAIPASIVAILVTTFLYYRRKSRTKASVEWENGEERANVRGEDSDADEANEPYRGYLWMKERYERLLKATDGRYFEMKDRLGVEIDRVGELNLIVIDLNATIADLTARLEANRKMLLNIHNEIGVAAAPVSEPGVTPATPSGGAGPEAIVPGEGSKIVGWVESGTESPEVSEVTRADQAT